MRPMLESMGDLRKGMSLLHEGQSTLSGVTASLQHKSALALQRVQELEQEKAVIERQFKTQIDIMQNAMKEQLSVSKEAVSTINALRHELAATQAESRRLHSEMHDSKRDFFSSGWSICQTNRFCSVRGHCRQFDCPDF